MLSLHTDSRSLKTIIEMGIVYPSGQHNTPAVTQYVPGAPIEEKMVVESYGDLTDPTTWGQIDYGCYWNLSIYQGMIVSVVNDTQHPENNGLWWLKTVPTAEERIVGQDKPTLSITGWEKIGGGSEVETDTQTILKNPTGKFIEDPNNPGHYIPDPNWTDPDSSDDNQIWVNQVNGGNW